MMWSSQSGTLASWNCPERDEGSVAERPCLELSVLRELGVTNVVARPYLHFFFFFFLIVRLPACYGGRSTDRIKGKQDVR